MIGTNTKDLFGTPSPFIFQLYATSEELASLLKSRRIHYSSHDPAPIKFYFTAVADIYYAKVTHSRQLECVAISDCVHLHSLQLSKLASGLERYLQGCFAARQEISVAFTNEDFTQLVQVSLSMCNTETLYLASLVFIAQCY